MAKATKKKAAKKTVKKMAKKVTKKAAPKPAKKIAKKAAKKIAPKKAKPSLAAKGKVVASDAKIVLNTAVGAAMAAAETVGHAVSAAVEKVMPSKAK